MRRLLGAALVLVAAACEQPKAPVVDGFEVQVTLTGDFNRQVITGLELVFDTAPGGPPLGLTAGAPQDLEIAGHPIRTGVRSVDGDADLEYVVTFRRSPFTANSFSFLFASPGYHTVPFSIRANVLSARGIVGSAVISEQPSGEPVVFGPGIRGTLPVAIACQPRVSCLAGANQPPKMAELPRTPVTVAAGRTFRFVLDGWDPDGDDLVFAADPVTFEALPGEKSFDAASRTFLWTPPVAAVRLSPWPISFDVGDNRGGTERRGLEVIVVDAAGNSDPVFTSVGTFVAAEGQTLSVALEATDPDGGAVVLALDPGGLPAGAAALVDPTTRTFTWTPAHGDAREAPYRVRVSAVDGRGGRAQLELDVIVVHVNRPPVLELPIELAVRAGVVASIPIGVRDPDGDPVTVEADFAGLPAGSGAALDGRADPPRFTWTPRAADVRDEPWSWILTASDGRASVRRQLRIRVRADNASPVVTPLGLQRVVEEQTLSFGLEVQDPDGDAVTISADRSGLPADAGAVFAGTAFSWTPRRGHGRSAPYLLTFTARDARGGETVYDLFVQVDPRGGPRLPAGVAFSGTAPPSPANENTPRVQGMAPAGTVVSLYTDPTCPEPPVGTATVAAGGTFSIPAQVADDSTTTFFTRIREAGASAPTECLPTGIAYVEDSQPPAAPGFTGTTPASPSTNNNPTLDGTAEPNAIVRVYSDADCGGNPAGTATAGANGSVHVSVSVASNSATTYFAIVTDAAGNSSDCTPTGITYVQVAGDGGAGADGGGCTRLPPLIAADLTVGPGCVEMGQSELRGTARLTLSPGTTVRVDLGGHLFVARDALSTGSTLIARGTPQAPIRFESSSTTPARGDWQCVWIGPSSTGSELRHVEFAHGGGPCGSATIPTALRIGAAIAALTDVTVRESSGTGLRLEAAPREWAGNRFSENERASIQVVGSPLFVGGSNTFTTGGDVVEVLAATVSAGGTWRRQPVPYRVVGDLKVDTTGTVTLEAGTVVQMSGGRLEVSRGTFVAVGQAELPIRFTSARATPQPGDWSCLLFTANSTGGEIRFAEIEYGGQPCNASTAALTPLDAAVRATRPLTAFSNVTVRRSAGYGLVLGAGAEPGDLTGNVFEGNAGASVRIEGNPAWLGEGQVFRTAGDFIEIRGATITAPGLWRKHAVPYRIVGGLVQNANVATTLEPGTVLQMDGGKIDVQRGTLTAIGDAENPVLITSARANPARGDWACLVFGASAGPSELRHLTLEYGGLPCSSGGGPAVDTALRITAPMIAVTEVTARHSAGHGITLGTQAALQELGGLVFEDNASPSLRLEGSPLRLGPSNTFLTPGDHIEVRGGTIQQTGTWRRQAVPYQVVGGLSVGGSAEVTIEAGTVIRMAGGSITSSNATLRAVGDALNPIYFTSSSATPQPGDWGCITFGTVVGLPPRFEHVVFEYAGSGAGCANFKVALNAPSSTVVTQSIFRNIDGSAIQGQAACNAAWCQNTFLNLAEGAPPLVCSPAMSCP